MTKFTKLAGPQKQIAVTLVAVAAVLISGCGAQRSYHFTPKSVTRINYDPKHCTELTDGRFKCKEVVFTVASIDASGSK
ncbi:MAG TPA: hypothetical protein VKW06_05710 [Candidatus Angelobacter sp.]|nr:hypothetical protein [Candidatus Angelobacter sp.]